MSLPKAFKLWNGLSIPSFGLGTWKSKPFEVGNAVSAALSLNITHLDCAAIYGNEAEIGPKLKEYLSTHPRESIFVTSKLWNSMHAPEDVEPALKKTLADLQLDYLDLYLIHWPVAFKPKRDGTLDSVQDPETKRPIQEDVPFRQTWEALEKLVDKGLVKSIGVSNCSITRLQELKGVRIPPAVNQVELHPYLKQKSLLKYCAQNNIHVTAYSPLGSGLSPNLLEDPTIVKIAQKNGKTPAQVLISWAIQRGTSVIPKSTKAERIKENSEVFVLPEEDFQAIENLEAPDVNEELASEKSHRFIRPIQFWGIDMYKEDENALEIISKL